MHRYDSTYLYECCKYFSTSGQSQDLQVAVRPGTAVMCPRRFVRRHDTLQQLSAFVQGNTRQGKLSIYDGRPSPRANHLFARPYGKQLCIATFSVLTLQYGNLSLSASQLELRMSNYRAGYLAQARQIHVCIRLLSQSRSRLAESRCSTILHHALRGLAFTRLAIAHKPFCVVGSDHL